MTSTTRGLSELGVWTVMVIVGFAGVLKFLDLRGFDESLDTWVLFPPSVRSIATYTVPTVEVFISASWMFGPRRRWVVATAASLLVVFSGSVAAHALSVGPPTCRCFGLLARYHEFQSNAWWILGRDTGLLAPLGFYLASTSGGAAKPHQPAAAPRETSCAARASP